MRWSATQFGNDSKIENTVAAIQISSRLNAALLGTQQSKSDAWGYFKAMAVKFSCGQTALGAHVSAGAACRCSPTQMGLGTKIAVHEWPINRATTLGAHAQAGGDMATRGMHWKGPHSAAVLCLQHTTYMLLFTLTDYGTAGKFFSRALQFSVPE